MKTAKSCQLRNRWVPVPLVPGAPPRTPGCADANLGTPPLSWEAAVLCASRQLRQHRSPPASPRTAHTVYFLCLLPKPETYAICPPVSEDSGTVDAWAVFTHTGRCDHRRHMEPERQEALRSCLTTSNRHARCWRCHNSRRRAYVLGPDKALN